MGETAEMIHEDALPRTGERARFEAGLASSILCAHDAAAKTAIAPGRVSTPVRAPA